MNFEAFKDKKVLVTGHTGFKGSWLTLWLNLLGAKVVGLGLEPITNPSLYKVTKISSSVNEHILDIRDAESVEKLIHVEQPDFVFHLAAQSLVRKSYAEPVNTWDTNVMGTINVLNGLRTLSKNCYAVFITSDKCYKNVEWIWGYRENDPLGGEDPYSASKAAAEIAIHSFVASYFETGQSNIRIATGRAGNVVGGGDWSEDRVIPDTVKSWSRHETALLRSPHSTRPWQHVLEPLGGYLSLAVQLSLDSQIHGESFNFGPSAQEEKTVLDLVSAMSHHWKKAKWEVALGSGTEVTEANLLRLNCDKASKLLNWKPTLSFDETVRMTAEWYREFYTSNSEIGDLCTSQLKSYMMLTQTRGDH